MEHKPQTKQRSKWTDAEITNVLGLDGLWHYRNVGDGQLRVLITDEPTGLHLSISHVYADALKRQHQGRPQGRYPTWDEIMDARLCLLPADQHFVMHLPRMDTGEYVALHDTTFHLHQHDGPVPG